MSWIRATEQMPPEMQIVAIMFSAGHSARGAGVIRYGIAQRLGGQWQFLTQPTPIEEPFAWAPLPKGTY